MIIRFRCESLPPGLLMNNPAGMLQAAEKKSKGATVPRVPPPEEEAEGGAYRLPDGTLYFPTLAFRRAAIDGGKGRKAERSRSGLNTVLAATLFIAGDRLETALFDPKTDAPLTEYEMDVQRAVVQGKSAVIRARPLIDPWAATVSFDLDDERVSPELLEQAFRIGGLSVGVGNYRPQKGGIYGRFTVERA